MSMLKHWRMEGLSGAKYPPGVPKAAGLKTWASQSFSICPHRRDAVWMTDISPHFTESWDTLNFWVFFLGQLASCKRWEISVMWEVQNWISFPPWGRPIDLTWPFLSLLSNCSVKFLNVVFFPEMCQIWRLAVIDTFIEVFCHNFCLAVLKQMLHLQIQPGKYMWKYLKTYKVLQIGLGCGFAASAVIPKQEASRLGSRGTVNGLPRDWVIVLTLFYVKLLSSFCNYCIFNGMNVFPIQSTVEFLCSAPYFQPKCPEVEVFLNSMFCSPALLLFDQDCSVSCCSNHPC